MKGYALNGKYERNINIYIKRKNGATFKELADIFNISQVRAREIAMRDPKEAIEKLELSMDLI